MTLGRIAATAAAILTLVAVVVVATRPTKQNPKDVAGPPAVLSVVVTRGQVVSLPLRAPAAGRIEAWQEASIGTEANGLRLTDVMVNVGDSVKRGQVLAVFDGGTIAAELTEARASVAQAEAEAAEADTNAHRAKSVEAAGAMSAQQVGQYVAAAKTARARLDAMRAVEKRNRIHVAQTRVLASSDGIISSRTATVGAVVPAGQELFRMIKEGRIEWRAAVSVSDLNAITPGQRATITEQGRPPVIGTVRMVSPVIDAQTHTGLVYIDLPVDRTLRVGLFVRGYLDMGEAPALTVPRNAVLLRDGFHYVMQVGPESSVAMKKVSLGRDIGAQVEITAGLTAADTIIASGLSFLSDGDKVRVVDAPVDEVARMDDEAP